MKIDLEPGKYVMAVSGGVDSVALLHMLVQQNQIKEKRLKRKDSKEAFNFQPSAFSSTNYNFVVAHLDHGIRPDSGKDAIFVMKLAETYGLPFVGASIRLGPGASEAEARKHRYIFLRRMVSDFGADAILTAHHQDDLIETAIINTLRGTGRKGLTSLGSEGDIKRPLLHIGKKDLIDYAKKHKLAWREDSTNQDPRYLRNRIRSILANKLDAKKRTHILSLLEKMKALNIEIDEEHAILLAKQPATKKLSRPWFVALPHAVALEMLAYWLREHNQAFDKHSLARLVNDIKTARPGSKTDVSGGSYISIEKDQISLKGRSFV